VNAPEPADKIVANRSVSAEVEAPQKRRRGPFRRMFRAVWRSRAMQTIAGETVALGLRFIRATNKLSYDPPNAYDRVMPLTPVIITMWHAEGSGLALSRPKDLALNVLVSRHSDGELMAVVARRFGLGTIRGSGGRRERRQRIIEKGGVRGFLEMKTSLESGTSVCMTADVSSSRARRAGEGIVQLAKASGRPVVPVAFATSRRGRIPTKELNTFNLPFGRAVLVVGDPISIGHDADEAEIERVRLAIEEALNRATTRARAIVDRKDG
jgi:lysophospholipid acyltransferase (LPLAT)-like uncharacterized protein